LLNHSGEHIVMGIYHHRFVVEALVFLCRYLEGSTTNNRPKQLFHGFALNRS